MQHTGHIRSRQKAEANDETLGSVRPYTAQKKLRVTDTATLSLGSARQPLLNSRIEEYEPQRQRNRL